MRRYYLDNIRWFTIVLVMIFHVFFYFNNIGTTAVFPGLAEYQRSKGMTLAGIYQYAVYPWFMTLLFVVAGMSAYYALQKKSVKEFIRGRRDKLLVPSTLGVLCFGFISGMMLVPASAKETMEAVPGFVKYMIYTASGIGALWFCQVLFIDSLVLLAVRKIVTKLCRKERILISSEGAACLILIVVYFLFWGSGKLLNTPFIESYRFGIYTMAFLLGYYIFSQDKMMEIIEKRRFVSLAAAVGTGAFFVINAYGTFYAKSVLLSSWYASLFAYFSILAVLGMSRAYADRQTKVTGFLSRVSFPVYIVHIPIMLIVLTGMSHFAISLTAKYIILAISTFLLAPIVGLAVEKVPVIRYIVLGIRKKEEQSHEEK